MLIRFSFLLILLQFFVFFAPAQQIGEVVFSDKPFKPELQKRKWLVDQLNGYEAYRVSLAEEKEFVYWTNHARLFPQSFLDSIILPFLKLQPRLEGSYSRSLIRSLESMKPLSLLTPTMNLIEPARDHATDLAKRRGGLSHSSSNGKSFRDRMQRAGIKYCYAENITESPDGGLIGLILLYLDIGVPGLGHRINLFNPNYTLMGVGASRRSNNQLIIVQDFACTQ